MKQLATVVKVKPSRMRKIGNWLIQRIWKDAAKGIMQDGKSGLNYSSRGGKYSYKAQKARGMKKLDPSRGKEPGSPRYHSVKGLHTDKQTRFVNLKLTGRMLRSLLVNAAETTSDQIVLTYKGEGQKVLHNKAAGRNVQSLNDKNLTFARDKMLEQMGKNIDEWSKESVDIVVG